VEAVARKSRTPGKTAPPILEHTTAMATKEQPELIVPDMLLSEPLETALSDMECCLSAAAH
jgi:hypothetical protein